jgi:hypothetical protein
MSVNVDSVFGSICNYKGSFMMNYAVVDLDQFMTGD